MVHKCVVRGCGSKWYPGCYVSFHLFPTDDVRRKEWLSIEPLKTNWYTNSKICSLQFNEIDYNTHSKRSKPTATPFFFDDGGISQEKITSDLMQEIESVKALNSSLRVYLEHVRSFKKNLMAMNSNCQQLSKVNNQWINALNVKK